MMSELSPERRRVVVLCSAVAATAGFPILLKKHPVLLGCWIVTMLVVLVYAVVQLAKLKREGK